MKKYFAFVIVLIICPSCMRHQIRITPEYQDKQIDAAKLLIYFSPEQLRINLNEKILPSDETGNEKEIYLSHFNNEFPESVKQNSSFQDVVFASKIFQFEERELNINKNEKLKFHIPLSEEVGNNSTEKMGYILFLQEMEINYAEGESDVMIPTSIGNIFVVGSEPQLVQTGKFLIWDDFIEMIVAYGRIEIQTEIDEENLEETWLRANDALANYLFGNTPFSNKNGL